MIDAICSIEPDIFPIRLWLLDLNIDPDRAQVNWLSERELDRAARFYNDRDRRQYIAAHCGLRWLLQDFSGIEAGRMEFTVAPLGKLSIRDAPDVFFNMSYAGDRALVGLSSVADIGVDLEALRIIEDADDLADEYFTTTERGEFFAAKATEHDRVFLQGWTRKEACIKAVGTGLSYHPSNFTSGLSAERATTIMTLGERVRTVEVRTVPISDRLVGACAIIVS